MYTLGKLDLTHRGRLALGALLAIVIGAGCSDDPVRPDIDENERGALLGFQTIEVVSEARIESFDLPIPIRSAVELKRIVYRTVSPSGALTEASALIAIPTDREDPLELAIAVEHREAAAADRDAALLRHEETYPGTAKIPNRANATHPTTVRMGMASESPEAMPIGSLAPPPSSVTRKLMCSGVCPGV